MAREHAGIETLVEVGVLPDQAAEVRRVTLVNRSARRRVIEVTSCAEVVLNDAAAHEAHPVFSKLFVQTEYAAAERTLLARRRPRAPDDEHPWLVHAIRQKAPSANEWETDRARFLGAGGARCRGVAALRPKPASGNTGNVLDPIVSLRAVVEPAPGDQACVGFLLGVAPSRELASPCRR
jgi:cyclic beta-1,2-glucan synthetase